MQMELVFTNERRTLPSVRAFVRETLRQTALADGAVEPIVDLTVAVVEFAIDGAYPAGEEGRIQLRIRDQQGRLEIMVRDYGLPQDIQQQERLLQATEGVGNHLFGVQAVGLVDEMHWLGYGPEGKAFQIIKWLHDDHVADRSNSDEITPFHDNAPLALEQKYDIRRMQPDEAVQVSQLMYRAYGATYFNEDVYYPERIAAQNVHGSLMSFVAVTKQGEVVGNYALELNQPGPVCEVGQAVVNPSHRNRGLLNQMKAAALERAAHLDLVGWYADAVCVHPFTQKSNADHGGRLTAVDLGIAPRTESFRNLAEQFTERISCMLYFHWIATPQPRVVHVPQRHRAMTARIYERLQCSLEFGTPQSPTGHGRIAIQVVDGARRASLRVDVLGADTVHAVLRAKRTLVERAKVEVVFVELPLTDPGAAEVAEALENAGFGYCGVAPHFSPQDDLLRLVYVVEPLTKAPIKIYEPFGEELVDYVLAEQVRVTALL